MNEELSVLFAIMSLPLALSIGIKNYICSDRTDSAVSSSFLLPIGWS